MEDFDSVQKVYATNQDSTLLVRRETTGLHLPCRVVYKSTIDGKLLLVKTMKRCASVEVNFDNEVKNLELCKELDFVCPLLKYRKESDFLEQHFQFYPNHLVMEQFVEDHKLGIIVLSDFSKLKPAFQQHVSTNTKMKLVKSDLCSIGSGRLYIALQLLCQLKQLWKIGIYHCDIGPRNIMIDRKNLSCVWIDFEFSKCSSDLSTYDNIALAGTRIWMFPKIFDFMGDMNVYTKEVNCQNIDLWALICTIYYVISGRKVYNSDKFKSPRQYHDFLETRMFDLKIPMKNSVYAFIANLLEDMFITANSRESILEKAIAFFYEALLSLESKEI